MCLAAFILQSEKSEARGVNDHCLRLLAVRLRAYALGAGEGDGFGSWVASPEHPWQPWFVCIGRVSFLSSPKMRSSGLNRA